MSTASQSPGRFVDAHCHLDLFPKPAALVRALDERRIETIAVTNAPSVFEHTEILARSSPYVHAAIGLHPELVSSRESELSRFWPYLTRTRFVGEVGLDYSTPDASVRAQQRRVFEAILEACAKQGDKILTVHSRRAAADVIAAIGNTFSGKVILHWFTGSHRDLRRAVDIGCYFSANITMLRSEKGRELLRLVPPNRLLTESDAPLASGNQERDGTPAVATAIDLLADMWRIDPAETQHSVSTTFDTLINPAHPSSAP